MFVVRSGSVVNNFSRTSVWFFAFVVACLVAPVTSVDVLKEAERIEKLADEVREGARQ